MRLTEYLTEKYNDDDWVVVQDRKVIKYIKNPKNNKAPSGKSFTSSKQDMIRISKAKQMGIKIE